jgi:hypothetical protein
MAPIEKTAMKADIRRFANTRGLRSIPYLIISNVSMTDACAVHLSSVLSIHRNPEHLLEYLPGGKALSLPDRIGCCNGIIWLPNRDLGSLAQELLTMTGEFRDWGSNSDSDDSSLRSRDPSHEHERRKKREIEYMRLTKRIRIATLKAEGVHSADIWSAALKMVVVCRALLLEDRARPVSNMSAVETSRLAEARAGINPEVAHMDASYIGPFHPTTKDFAHHFPTIQGMPTLSSVGTPSPRPGRDRDHTPSRPAKAPVRTTASTVAPPQEETWRFSLPTEAWRRIIAHAVNAEGILDRQQQIRIMQYASDWSALAQELGIKGMADYQQIWKILDSVGCFTYTPLS